MFFVDLRLHICGSLQSIYHSWDSSISSKLNLSLDTPQTGHLKSAGWSSNFSSLSYTYPQTEHTYCFIIFLLVPYHSNVLLTIYTTHFCLKSSFGRFLLLKFNNQYGAGYQHIVYCFEPSVYTKSQRSLVALGFAYNFIFSDINSRRLSS